MNFTETEHKIIYRLQHHLPLKENPFRIIAEELQLPGTELLETIRDLKQRNIIRNISGIFNTKKLGYVSTLVAFQVPENNIESAARKINSHPGVSHNYQRDHRYNIWFTLAVPTEDILSKTIQYLVRKTNATDYLLLRNEKEYKIRVLLNPGRLPCNLHPKDKQQSEPEEQSVLSEQEEQAVTVLQQDLPLAAAPFKILTEKMPVLSETELLTTAEQLRKKGILKRLSAVLRHHKSGYTHNGMSVWQLPPGSDPDSVAEIFRKEPSVSHLYKRTVYPGKWEYPLFAMIHATSDNELKSIIHNLSKKSGLDNYQVLTTIRELKKERVHYFSDEFEQWNNHL